MVARIFKLFFATGFSSPRINRNLMGFINSCLTKRWKSDRDIERHEAKKGKIPLLSSLWKWMLPTRVAGPCFWSHFGSFRPRQSWNASSPHPKSSCPGTCFPRSSARTELTFGSFPGFPLWAWNGNFKPIISRSLQLWQTANRWKKKSQVPWTLLFAEQSLPDRGKERWHIRHEWDCGCRRERSYHSGS